VEVDRMLTQVLHANTRKFDSNYLCTLNYRAGNSPTSVKPSFFLRGNEGMAQRYPSAFPWNRLLPKIVLKHFPLAEQSRAWRR
jgi:hypothetical protein